MFTCPDCKFEAELWDILLEHYFWVHGVKRPAKYAVKPKKNEKDSKDK